LAKGQHKVKEIPDSRVKEEWVGNTKPLILILPEQLVFWWRGSGFLEVALCFFNRENI